MGDHVRTPQTQSDMYVRRILVSYSSRLEEVGDVMCYLDFHNAILYMLSILTNIFKLGRQLRWT